MRTCRRVFGLALLAFAAGAALAQGDEGKPGEAPKEESVVPHDSQTRGAVQVKSVGDKPADWFDVLKDGKRAFPGGPKLLNSTVELAPGAYVVEVNRTRRKVTVEAGKKTVLWTGELVVEGKGADWYAPYQGKERKLANNPPVLNRPTALFPGTYTVLVRVGAKDKKLGEARVRAGLKTVLKH
jgi:hypothetical protein